MTVRKNIGYPFKTRGIKGAKADQWVEEIAELVDCERAARPLPGTA